MPKQKASKGAVSSEISDPRFSNFTTDPRFRLPSKKTSRTKVDKRFSRMLEDEDFTNSAKVDRYGRKLSGSAKKKALERLYAPEDEDDEEEGEVEIEVEKDEVVEKELKKYDAARGGGFSSSDEDSDEDDSDSGGVEIDDEAAEAEFPDMQAQEGVEMGEVSSRIAVVNLDWDNIRSVDLMAVFSSFVSASGKIHKISIYQSEFGKERMEREEMEGPPKEIFARQEEEAEECDSEEDSEDDEEEDEKIKKSLIQEDEGKEFDGAALRQYQLERLRYYYAVVVCSDNDTARRIYEDTDGTEYLSSANFFDLRFIPDDTNFDDNPRDECTSVPAGYKPIEFVTDALQHSKVKLTWDQNPEEASRKDAINRAFSGSRAELGENDLRAYLGSDSEDESVASEPVPQDGGDEIEEDAAPKLTKKDLARKKMRDALGLASEPAPKASKTARQVGDMEITFTAGLSSSKSGGVFSNSPIIEETTAEAYVRKERERKARRKEKAKAIREGRDPESLPSNSDPKDLASKTGDGDSGGDEADLGFNDPFFSTETTAAPTKSARKADRAAKREVRAAEEASKASQRAELELLMTDAPGEAAEHLDHFDINEIARAEKLARKKGKMGKKGDSEEGGKRGGLQETFDMDVQDPRFSKVYESHEFAIDPSNPRFKGTEGMKKLLEEGRRKRGVDGDETVARKEGKKRRVDVGSKSELSGLVESVKKKAKR